MVSRLFDEGQHNPPGHELAGPKGGRKLPATLKAVPPMPTFPKLRAIPRQGGEKR